MSNSGTEVPAISESNEFTYYYTLRWSDTIWCKLLNLVISPIGYQLPVEGPWYKLARFVGYNLGCPMDRCDRNYAPTLILT